MEHLKIIINNICVADDKVTLAHNLSHFHHMMSLVVERRVKYGVLINVNKTKLNISEHLLTNNVALGKKFFIELYEHSLLGKTSLLI